MKTKILFKSTTAIIGILITLLFLGFIFCVNIFHFTYNMNSDIGAEAILGREIARTHQLVPESWYPSTETRVINSANLAGLFNLITGHMNLSMGLACFTTSVLIVLSVVWVGRSWRLPFESVALLTALSLILPTTLEALGLTYLFACYYGACTIILLITLGIYARLSNAEDSCSKTTQAILCFLSLLLSFLLGLQGMRGILVIYAPLLGFEIIRTLYLLLRKKTYGSVKFKALIWATALFLFSFIGTKMPISTSSGEISKNLRQGFSKLFGEVIPSIGEILGVGTGTFHNIILIILGMVALLDIALIIRRLFQGKLLLPCQKGFTVLVISPILTALIVSFTTFDNSARYYYIFIFVLASAIPVLISDLSSSSSLTTLVIGLALILTVSFSVIQIRNTYVPILTSKEPPVSDAYEVVQILKDNNIDLACASFDNANTIMCLSDGTITVRAVNDMSKMDPCKWLTSKDFFKTCPMDSPERNHATAYIVTEITSDAFNSFFSTVPDAEKQSMIPIGKYSVYILSKDYAK